MKKSGTKPVEAVPPKASSQAPAPAAERTKAAAPRSHKVQTGDTLFSIARRYGVSLETLRRINKLTPGQSIHPGDSLIVEER
ncbi:MAG: LysM peptidoglycan-binding domain-containing protein [Desulfobacterales bacterium]|uniref:LysM peptidoglycan-binding domain-containing protein n=1 Tax=Candidatus Desulfatibia profunda TaxID=2841695 RepID=A0A8J6TLI3_9BACT|nr:LysM peptidoglycan-binding domain-containing protein [Candidatus Desulfatibia profunda]MBL7178929.1 LysM peptidoglycan-binding domain-containing protein [Desulfobacterales bacterium]MBU0698870.1 LysM peptidoglycan-binding domain-containing protein [Pseudomonadota bacterium]